MDREKFKELIMDSGEIASAVGMQEWVVEKIADHLIANGIGDITAEKHRADVAEEALKLACQQIGYELHQFGVNKKIVVEPRIIEFKEQAEERLRGRV